MVKIIFFILIVLTMSCYAQQSVRDSLTAHRARLTALEADSVSKVSAKNLIADSLNVNARSFSTVASTKSLINDSLNANSRSFTTLAVTKGLINDSLKNADSINTRALVLDGDEDLNLTIVGSISGIPGLSVGGTVVVDEGEGTSPSVGYAVGGYHSDLVPPATMTGNWDWALPDKSGSLMTTADTAFLSNRINALSIQILALYDSIETLREITTIPNVPVLAISNTTSTITISAVIDGAYDSLIFYKSYDNSTFFQDTAFHYSAAKGYTDTILASHENRYYYATAKYSGVVSANSDTVLDFITDNYYTALSADGDETGSSWANALRTLEWESGAGTNRPLPGDTVFIDGGTDSVVYTWGMYEWGLNGTEENPIYFIRSTEAGHNGRPIFGGNAAYGDGQGIYWHDANYLVFDNIVFTGFPTDPDPAATKNTIALVNGNGITFKRCEVRHHYSQGFVLSDCDSITVDSCTLYARYNTLVATDGFHIDKVSTNCSNITIRYNTIENSNPQTDGTIFGHRDLIQFAKGYGLANNSETVIAYNFFHEHAASDNPVGIIYAWDVSGKWKVYNNVLKTTSAGGGDFFQIADTTLYTGTVSTAVDFHNNTMYSSAVANRGISFYGDIDSIRAKNNILYTPENAYSAWYISQWAENTAVMDIDDNQYYIGAGESANFAYMREPWDKETTTPVTLDFSQWQAAGRDVNGEFVAASFASAGGNNAVDYKLGAGTQGVDEGTALTLFTDDFEFTARTVWDRGAFER